VLRDVELDGVYFNSAGTFGDVHMGMCQGSAIAIKQLRISKSNVTKVLKVSNIIDFIIGTL